MAVLLIGPKDFPEIARYLIKTIAKIKHFIVKAKSELDLLGKEIGIEEIKNELSLELANEKTRMEKELTTIIDIYGNEHQVYGVEEIRKDRNKEELATEVAELNKKNSTKHL